MQIFETKGEEMLCAFKRRLPIAEETNITPDSKVLLQNIQNRSDTIFRQP